MHLLLYENIPIIRRDDLRTIRALFFCKRKSPSKLAFNLLLRLNTLTYLRVIKHQFHNDLTRKTAFFEGWSLVQVQSCRTGTRCELEILHQRGRRIKTKSQKVYGTNSCVSKSYRGSFCTPLPHPEKS